MEKIVFIAKSQPSKVVILFCLLAVFVSHMAGGLHAQDQSQRKAITRVAPKYPEELKKQQLGGRVRLSVVITPDGSVKSVKGNQREPSSGRCRDRSGEAMEIRTR